jgi:hypothetical protein
VRRRLAALSGRLPWWLKPWGAYLSMQRAFGVAYANECQQAMLIRKQDRDIDSLREQIRRLRLGSGEGMPSTQTPDFVLVGIPRGPGMGVRVIASRNLAGTRFDMTPQGEVPLWVIRATMAQALFVDKPSYGEAIGHIGNIWANWDRDKGSRDEATAWRPGTVYQKTVLPGSPSRGIMQTEPPKAIEQKGITDAADQGN